MQIHFLPWAGITQPITIGPVTITPWPTLRTTLPQNTRTFLDNYFTRYRTNNNQPITDVSIASITPNPLANITDHQRATIQRAVDALTITSIIPNLRATITTGNTFAIPNSERFQLTTQYLGTLSPHIAIRTRGMTHVWNMNQIHFCAPWEAGSTNYQTDDELLTALGKLLAGTRHVRLRERIFNTIEWCRLSNTGNPGTSDLSRLVMKATAFEVLLEPNDPFQKRDLMTQRLHNLTDNPKLRRKSIRISKKKTRTVNAVAAWLNQFYQLRNAIVHGDTMTPAQLNLNASGTTVSHLAIADLVLYEAITWELITRRLAGGQTRRAAHSFVRALGKTNASDALITRMLSSHFQLTGYHQALGWNKK